MAVARIDLNCDLGEYDAEQLRSPSDASSHAARDDALMASISSANIACGAHAGDETVMRWTLHTALRHGVAAGAHPGFADRPGFGRRMIPLPPDAVYDLVAAQIAALDALAREAATALAHVKPHGALYNVAAADRTIADAIAAAVRDRAPHAVLFGLAGSALLEAGRAARLATAAEAFADRGYEADGSLTPRGAPGALVTDPHDAAARVLRMVSAGKVTTTSGVDIDIAADTICIHGDGPTAVEIARAVRHALESAGIRVTAPGTP